MPRMQRKTPSAPQRSVLPPVPTKEEPAETRTATQRKPQSAAVDRLLDEAAARGEGRRILVAGATRKGKTTLTKKIAVAMIDQKVARFLVIHDQKYPQHVQYSGTVVDSVDKAREAMMHGQRIIVCRHPMTVEDAAGLVRELVEMGYPACLLNDEMMPALKVNEDTGEPMNRVWCGPTPIWILLQGGGLGGSLLQLLQIPLSAPTSLIDNCDYVCFNLGGRSLKYLIDLGVVPREAADTVQTLQPGEFCLFFADAEWDRTIYGPN